MSRSKRRWGRPFAALATTSLVGAALAVVIGPAEAAPGTVTGTVFNDFASDGVYNTTATVDRPAVDVGVAGVQVRAFNNAGALVGEATSGADGTYSLAYDTGDDTSQVRLEFEVPAGYEPARAGFPGATNGSTVQFKSAGQVADLGVIEVGGYAPANPRIAVAALVGEISPNGASTSDDLRTVITYNYNDRGWDPAVQTEATKGQTGSVWGIASRGDDYIFSAAALKRHAKVGPGGLGQIYLTQAGGAPDAAPWVTIPNVGQDPRGATPDYYHDPAAYPEVGKVGLGGITLSPDDSTLYAINLADKGMYSVALNGAAGTAPTAGTPARIGLPLGLPGAQAGCAADSVRPFGVSAANGALWVPLTCTGPTAGDLRLYVYRYDLATGTFDASPAIETALSGYSRGQVDDSGANASADWQPWSDVIPTSGGADGRQWSRPQPMASDVQFDSNGDLTVALKDRFADQSGYQVGAPDAADPQPYTGTSAGDVLRFCGTAATGWTQESAGQCGTRTGAAPANNQGPGGGEFYDDDYSNIHSHVASGALLQVPGFADLSATAFDALDPAPNPTHNGVRYLGNGNGANNGATVLEKAAATGDVGNGSFGKAGGLGDLDMLARVPVEIGNRVWLDSDKDGIQDASELPIAGVQVTIVLPDGSTASTVTNAQGEYYFNDANVPGGLPAGTQVKVRLDRAADYAEGGPLFGFTLTQENAGSPAPSTADAVDSDGVMVDGFPEISLTTPETNANHTYDFGFWPPAPEPTPTPTTPVPTPTTPVPTTPVPTPTTPAPTTPAPTTPAPTTPAPTVAPTSSTSPTPTVSPTRKSRPKITTETKSRVRAGSGLTDTVKITNFVRGGNAQGTATLYGPFRSAGAIRCTPANQVGSVNFKPKNGTLTTEAITVVEPGYYNWVARISADKNNRAASHKCGLKKETSLATKKKYKVPTVSTGYDGYLPGSARAEAMRLRMGSPRVNARVVSSGLRKGSMVIPASPGVVGHLRNSADIGDLVGSAVIAGHVSNRHDAPGAFYRLSSAKIGSVFSVRLPSGKMQKYKVSAKEKFSRSRKLPKRFFRTGGSAQLVLISCADRIVYPNGHFHYRSNIVVTAKPIK